MTIFAINSGDLVEGHGQIPLKVPNVAFNSMLVFDVSVSVDSMQLLKHALKT